MFFDSFSDVERHDDDDDDDEEEEEGGPIRIGTTVCPSDAVGTSDVS